MLVREPFRPLRDRFGFLDARRETDHGGQFLGTHGLLRRHRLVELGVATFGPVEEPGEVEPALPLAKMLVERPAGGMPGEVALDRVGDRHALSPCVPDALGARRPRRRSRLVSREQRIQRRLVRPRATDRYPQAAAVEVSTRTGRVDDHHLNGEKIRRQR